MRALFKVFIIQKDADNNQWPSVLGGSHAGKHANVTRGGDVRARAPLCTSACVTVRICGCALGGRAY